MRVVIVCLLALLAAGCDRQNASKEQGEAPASTSKIEDNAAIDRAGVGRKAPDATFKDPDGQDVTLASFAGKPLLLNLWATWCAPCIAEMPELDTLAAKRSDMKVLTVSQDSEGSEQKVADFFRDRKLNTIEPYVDTNIELMTKLGAANLPTTILFDAEGKEVWRVTGALEWTGDKAAKLLDEAR